MYEAMESSEASELSTAQSLRNAKAIRRRPVDANRSSSYDPGHVAGTTQSEFDVQQSGQQGEKTTREKTEEELVMDYVRKQSLLEQFHRDKRDKGSCAAATDDGDDDEDLRRALELSVQVSDAHELCRYAQGSAA